MHKQVNIRRIVAESRRPRRKASWPSILRAQLEQRAPRERRNPPEIHVTRKTILFLARMGIKLPSRDNVVTRARRSICTSVVYGDVNDRPGERSSPIESPGKNHSIDSRNARYVRSCLDPLRLPESPRTPLRREISRNSTVTSCIFMRCNRCNCPSSVPAAEPRLVRSCNDQASRQNGNSRPSNRRRFARLTTSGRIDPARIPSSGVRAIRPRAPRSRAISRMAANRAEPAPP